MQLVKALGEIGKLIVDAIALSNGISPEKLEAIYADVAALKAHFEEDQDKCEAAEEKE